MSPDELAELCDETWKHTHVFSEIINDSEREKKEKALSFCFNDDKGFHLTRSCTGNDCEVQPPECQDAIRIGGFHTHPLGAAEFSDGDYRAAIKDNLSIIMVGTCVYNTLEARCVTFNYDIFDNLPDNEQHNLMLLLQQANILGDKSDKLLDEDYVTESIAVEEEVIAIKEDFENKAKEVGFMKDCCSLPCEDGVWKRRI